MMTIGAVDAADVIRLFTVLVGGASVGVALAVARAMVPYLDRWEAHVVRLMIGIHVSVVVFLAAVLAEVAGKPLTWKAPAALAIFTAKFVVLCTLREVIYAKNLRRLPPNRRHGDGTSGA